MTRDEDTTGVHRLALRRHLDEFHEVKASLKERIASALERSARDRPLVLAVDDEEAVQETYRRLFRDFADVRAAYTVDEACQDLRAPQKPDLVLLDLSFPGGGDGFDVAAIARILGHRCPIIVVSGYVDEGVRARFRRLPGNAIDCLPKTELLAVRDRVRESLRTPRGTPKP